MVGVTIEFEHLVFCRDPCIGDDIVDFLGWRKSSRCVKKVYLVFPARGVAFDKLGPTTPGVRTLVSVRASGRLSLPSQFGLQFLSALNIQVAEAHAHA